MSRKTEKIFEDILDDEFIAIFKPIFYFLSPFGMRGVTMKYKFVTAPTVRYKIFCCIIWFINYMCVVHTVIRCRSRFDHESTDVPLKAGMMLNGCINIFLAWRSVYYSGHTNSQMYVKLQRIERVLKMNDPRNINRKLSRVTTAASVVISILFAAYFLYFNLYMMEGSCPTASVGSAVSAMSYFEMFLVITILIFITQRARYVNDMLMENSCVEMDTVYMAKGSIVKQNVPDELVEGMFSIVDCYADVMDVFQHAILFVTLQMLVWQLISMQNLVSSIKKQMSVDIISFLSIVLRNDIMPSSFVYVGVMLTICLISQSLSTTLEESKKLCTKFTLSCEGKSRDNAKRMILILDGKRDATIYDIFTLDTQLLTDLFAVTASYTIVLLQVAEL